MIKYIVNTPYGSKIIKSNKILLSKDNNLTIIKKMCIENLFTYEGYLKAINKLFSKKHNIPVFINRDNQFIPIKRVRDYDNIWVNYSQVLTYKKYDNQTVIIFKDYQQLEINLKVNLFEKRVKMLYEIYRYKNSNQPVWNIFFVLNFTEYRKNGKINLLEAIIWKY